MTSTNKIITAIVIAAVLIIGIGYAAIGNIILNIEGTAKALASQSNFSVVLADPEVSSTDIVTSAEVTNGGTSAEFTIENMTAKGDVATITYTVKNNSADLTASLTASESNNNTEYFDVSYVFENSKTTIEAGDSTKVTVTVELIKTPISDETVQATVGLSVTAQPIQPN